MNEATVNDNRKQICGKLADNLMKPEGNKDVFRLSAYPLIRLSAYPLIRLSAYPLIRLSGRDGTRFQDGLIGGS
jgi:hypothetical protein